MRNISHNLHYPLFLPFDHIILRINPSDWLINLKFSALCHSYIWILCMVGAVVPSIVVLLWFIQSLFIWWVVPGFFCSWITFLLFRIVSVDETLNIGFALSLIAGHLDKLFINYLITIETCLAALWFSIKAVFLMNYRLEVTGSSHQRVYVLVLSVYTRKA